MRYSKGDVPLFQILRSADDKDLEEYKAKHANLGGVSCIYIYREREREGQ